MTEFGALYFEEVGDRYRSIKDLADRAVSQLDDGLYFAEFDGDSNSVAVLVKHIAGNMISRWTDFLTTDGQKPGRNRDAEFERETDGRAAITDRWERAWKTALETLAELQPEDAEKTVTIRGERHTVIGAIERNLAHTAYHTGQIVQLARHLASDNWKTLSIPRGGSDEFDRNMQNR